MARTRAARSDYKSTVTRTAKNARSLRIGNGGIKSGRDFAGFMSGLLSDVVSGKVDPRVANAACNVAGKLLKVVEMEFKYARQQQAEGTAVTGLPASLRLAE